MAILSGSLFGCATIRKFHPLQSNIAESRRLTQQAEAAIHAADWDRAESHLVKAIERFPNDSHARNCLADVLWERGAGPAAVEQMTKSIELSGRRDPLALTRLGHMELTQGDLDAAFAHAREALQYDQSLPETWTLQGFVLLQQGHTPEALNCFFRSLSLRSDCLRTRLEIAKIYRQQGELSRGLSMLGAGEASLGTDEDQLDYAMLRGFLLKDLGRDADAVLAFSQAQQIAGDRPDVLFHLAESHLAAGNFVQAEKALAKANGTSDETNDLAFQNLWRQIDLAMKSREFDRQ